MKRFSISLYLTSLVSLLIYSYSQIDLNLTLSSNSLYQAFQQQLIHLGYFNRPLSTLIYLIILSTLFTSYLLLIHQAKNNKLTFSNIIKLVLTTSGVLLLAYPAFSHDIFNYIFDARILAEHGANPYTHTALDFPSDLWTRFMRWTHRTYPYGPTWLPLTLVFYFAGLGKFTLTLFSFKLLGTTSYLISCYAIAKIFLIRKSKLLTQGVVLFAFNPVIIVESLVTSHLDIAMTAFMLAGLAFYLNSKKLIGSISLLFSIGIKYVSAGLAPFLFLFQQNKINFNQQIRYSLLATYLITLYIITQREILPWYFITPFGLTALIPNHNLAVTAMFGLTIATLLRYAPFLYIGNYTPWVNSSRDILSLASFVIIAVSLYFSKNKLFRA